MSPSPSGQDYYINEELAYTEDHVLVKNLFLDLDPSEKGRQTGNIAGKLEQQQLQKYFEEYGCVKRLDLYPSENGSVTGYVIFVNPSSAAKVLLELDMYHYVNGCRITVTPHYSWHQPDAEKMPEKPENVDPNEPPAAIMKLNDHCLEYIFSQLSVPDRIHFARTCFRFRSIYEGMSPILDKSINFELFEVMTDWELRDFFQLSGLNVKNIEGSTPRGRCNHVCFYLSMHCSNLQSMIISNDSEKIKFNIFKLFANLNSLQSLKLKGCDLTDEHLQALKNLKQLKKLDLSCNDIITGQYMNCLPNSIETLILSGCKALKLKFVIEMLRRLPLLKELHLTNNISGPDIQALFNENCCKLLEVLLINYDSNELAEYKHIARLPSLKKLILTIGSLPSPKLITWLVEYKSKQLEHFEIITARSDWIKDEILLEIGKLAALHTLILKPYSVITDRGLGALFNLQELREIDVKGNNKITDNGVLRLILDCPKLQVLHLEDCEQLTDKLLHNIILKLQNNQNHRPLPIKLYMTGTKVKQFTLLNADVAAKNIIDLLCTKVDYVGDENDFNDYENDYDNFVDSYYEKYGYNDDDDYDNYSDNDFNELL